MIHNYLPNQRDCTKLSTNVPALSIDVEGRLVVQADTGFPRIDIGGNVDMNYDTVPRGCIHIPQACDLVCEARVHTNVQANIQMVLRAQHADGTYMHASYKPNTNNDGTGIRTLRIETSVDDECWISWKLGSRSAGTGVAADCMLLMEAGEHEAMIIGGIAWFDGYTLPLGWGVHTPSAYPHAIQLEVAA